MSDCLLIWECYQSVQLQAAEQMVLDQHVYSYFCPTQLSMHSPANHACSFIVLSAENILLSAWRAESVCSV